MKLVHFEKKMGLLGAIAITVGAVIGVGIFVIVGPMGRDSGPWLPLTFLIAAVPAIIGALVACALGSTIPRDAGGFFYTKLLFGRYPATIVSGLIIIGAVGAMMTVSVGVANYVGIYFPTVPKPAIAIGMILLAWLVNEFGVMASATFQIITVAQLISGILLVIIAALIGGAHPDFSQSLPRGIPGFMQASVIAMLTYTGWNIVGEMGDEIENPKRNIPLTIIFGLGIVMVLYIGIGWVVSGSLSVTEMGNTQVAVLDTAMRYLPKWTSHYINLAAFSAAITSVNAVFLAVPREFSALSEEGILPKWIMKFNPKRQTFPVSIALIAIAGCALTFLPWTPDIWGMFCVAGLLTANVFFSIGAIRLPRLFPDQVKNAPFPIKKFWLYPSGVLGAIFSLAFAGMAFYFFQPIILITGILCAILLFLAWRSA